VLDKHASIGLDFISCSTLPCFLLKKDQSATLQQCTTTVVV